MMSKSKVMLTDFDRLVNAQLKKSVVVAPSDPNGGAKLPKRQSDAATRKVRGSTQYPAIFDREAAKSGQQLSDWERATQATTQSPVDFVNDDDDAPEDYDAEQWEDNRAGHDGIPGVYDPYGDDDELDDDDIESLDLPDDDDEYVRVRSHKRRKVQKSRGDMDEEFVDLSDDDDDLGETDDDDDDDDDKKKKKVRRRVKKSRADDEPEDDDADDEDDDEEDLRAVTKSTKRRQQMRKALGSDAMRYVDGSPLVKSLVDAVMDWRSDMQSEIRALRWENKQLAKMVKRENRQMAKALVTSQIQLSAGVEGSGQPLRKSMVAYGQPLRTTQRVAAPQMDLTKAFDVLDAALEKGGDPILSRDVTMLEIDGMNALASLSNAAREELHKANLI